MPYYEDEVTEVRLPAGVRANRAKRRKQRRHRRIATVAVLGLAAVAWVVAPAARSWAHTIDVSVRPACVEGKVYQDVTVNSQNGDYRFAGTATDTEGHSVPVNLPAGGGSTTVRLGPVSGPGSVRVLGDFYKDSGRKAEHMDRTVSYRFLDDCKPVTTTTSPPTTTPPVTTQPPTKQRTPVVGPPDQHRTPPVKKAPPEVTPPTVKQPQPGQLPFTGPRDWLLPAGLVLVLTGALMVLGGRRRYQQLSLVEKAVDRAMHGRPYDGPHEPV